MPSRATVVSVLAAVVVAISLAAIFTKLAEAPGPLIAFWRMVFATALLAPWVAPRIRRSDLRKETLLPTVAAGFFLAVHFASWLSSFAFTTVAASVTIVTTLPLWVALIGWAMGIRPTRGVFVGLAFALAGGVTIGFGDLAGGSAPLLGDGLALIGAWSAAGYFLLGRAAQKRGLSTMTYALLVNLFAGVFLLPLPWAFGVPYLDWPAHTWAWIVAMALVPQLIGHGGLNWANRHLDPTVVSTVTLLEPVGAGILAVLIFGEIPGVGVLIGAPILLFGVALVVRYRRRAAPEPSPAAPQPR
jgi:drug/metabolite transporter (DMT)-like permease